MRLLLLLPSMAGIGGAERMVANLADLLSSEHEVHIAAFDAPGTQPRFGSRAIFHALGVEIPRPLALRWLTYRDQARALGRLKRRLGIEVTISNLWRSDLVSVLSRGTDRKVALAHINVVGNATNARMMRLRPLVAAIYRRFDRIVTVSEALRSELTGLYRLSTESVRTIPNFVPSTTVPARPTELTRLAWCGRMVDEKNLDGLLAVMAILHRQRDDLRLDLIGDGPLRRITALRAAAMGLGGDDPAVRFHGMQGDPASLIVGAAALVLPSRAEGFGLVLVEAMGVGVPVIAADCASGGVRDVMAGVAPHDPTRDTAEETACGLLLPVPQTPAAIALWARTIADLLDSPARQAALAAGARDRARDFTPQAAMIAWESLLAGLMP